MSSDFICSVLEIDNNQEPKWNAARKAVAEWSDTQACEKLIVALNLDVYIPSKNEEQYNLVESVKFELDLIDQTPKEYILQAIDMVERMWFGDAYGALIHLRHSMILVTGESSYGDEPTGVHWMAVFEGTGCAKIAGFY